MSRPECRQPLTGLPGKFNLISTLSAFYGSARRPGGCPEGVDAVKRALYKTLNGGGRNPAAAVL
jgi:hypothetical protein